MQYGCNRTNAAATIKGNVENPMLRGQASFVQKRNGVLVTVKLSGLPKTSDKGFFALHIHEGEGCEGKDFAETQGHYNPEDEPHPSHAGDLPPLLSCNGSAYISVLTNRFRIADIIGKTIVIHSDADDFRTQPSGNSGKKIACGIIRIS